MSAPMRVQPLGVASVAALAPSRVERAGDGPRLPSDEVQLSAAALERETEPSVASVDEVEDAEESEEAEAQDDDELTQEDEQVVEELKSRDAEVRAHELAHARVGGRFAGQPSYEYQTGPDGQQYAVGGSVPIDVSEVPDDPRATIEKMQVVRRAAMAPAEPSTQDRRVAAEAAEKMARAQVELREQETGSDDGDDEPASAEVNEDASPPLEARQQMLAPRMRQAYAQASAVG